MLVYFTEECRTALCGHRTFICLLFCTFRLEFIVLKLHDLTSLNAFKSILKEIQTELLGCRCLNWYFGYMALLHFVLWSVLYCSFVCFSVLVEVEDDIMYIQCTMDMLQEVYECETARKVYKGWDRVRGVRQGLGGLKLLVVSPPVGLFYIVFFRPNKQTTVQLVLCV